MSEASNQRDGYWTVVEPDGTIAIPPELLSEMGAIEGEMVAIDVTDRCMVLRRPTPAEAEPSSI